VAAAEEEEWAVAAAVEAVVQAASSAQEEGWKVRAVAPVAVVISAPAVGPVGGAVVSLRSASVVPAGATVADRVAGLSGRNAARAGMTKTGTPS